MQTKKQMKKYNNKISLQETSFLLCSLAFNTLYQYIDGKAFVNQSKEVLQSSINIKNTTIYTP